MSSSHEPDTPFGSAHRWDTFHDAQVIDECSGVVVDTFQHLWTRTDWAFFPWPRGKNTIATRRIHRADVQYSIEWKVTVNNRVVARDTEQDIILVPAAYWHMYLKPEVEKLSSKKVAHNRHVEYDDTGVVVSVNDRSERDLTKRFDNMNIDWSVVEKQLVRHMEDEQETSGSPSVWQEVYGLMRCPGPPCNLGPHCWRDPFGKWHYKLRTHHLEALVDLVQQGHTLKSHDDVPEDIREQLYAEEHQRQEQHTAATSAPTPSLPPISITNVMPSQPQPFTMTKVLDSSGNAMATDQRSRSLKIDIPGPRDAAVIAYCEWQQSNVVDEALKDEFRKACVATLEDGLDLEQVYEDQDPGFFVQSGVKRGVARRFVSDIDRWAKRYNLSYEA
ncbi:hypothetical protein E8E13_001709 [Curvularia kusanoi]|uniref:Uncharacterized protein n=1 Tax=Curvularia kusanoi TaxID=90978 RepID=A0A9P4W6W4_CURKU|nr:hypothetical protein E8E13_001709 [Curvularia kusanoi]